MQSTTANQEQALRKLLAWQKAKIKPQYITLGGYAGTGKTTLIAKFRQELYQSSSSAKHGEQIKVAFCAYTGKAVRVLGQKLSATEAKIKGDFLGTIHSLIYEPVLNARQEITGWTQKEQLEFDLIIIDEASMVTQEIWRDLLTYEIPILAVGDHGQLPPINSNFNLMQKPDLVLSEIMRQESGNPIIDLSMQARKGETIAAGSYGQNVRVVNQGDEFGLELVNEFLANTNSESLILCGFNYTRRRLNKYVRAAKEFSDPRPQVGDRVICLQNYRAKGIYNGMIGQIKEIDYDLAPYQYFARVAFPEDDIEYSGPISAAEFDAKLREGKIDLKEEEIEFTPSGVVLHDPNQERQKLEEVKLNRKIAKFDFGYALTVHKAQGSQARKVLVFAERSRHMSDDMWQRWLYTAITRAEDQLILVI